MVMRKPCVPGTTGSTIDSRNTGTVNMRLCTSWRRHPRSSSANTVAGDCSSPPPGGSASASKPASSTAASSVRGPTAAASYSTCARPVTWLTLADATPNIAASARSHAPEHAPHVMPPTRMRSVAGAASDPPAGASPSCLASNPQSSTASSSAPADTAAGSYVTSATPAVSDTLALETPSADVSARSTAPEHAAQVMPNTRTLSTWRCSGVEAVGWGN
eukprot:364588-Chlamydomonas_euryale.AAC.14